MLQDTALWIAIAVVLVGLGVAYANPSTRPYAKKYGWLAVALAVGLLVLVLFRRRGGHPVDDAIDEGKDIQRENSEALDAVVDYAMEQHERADVELKMNRQESEAERKETQAKLETIDKVEDSMERRKALIALSREIS